MGLFKSFLKTLATGSRKHQSQLLNAHLHQKLMRVLRHIDASVQPLQCIYDIGAHRGAWSIETKKSLTKAQFYLFEANPAAEPDLRQTGFPYFISVLSSVEEYVDFYSKNGTGDSYFREKTAHYDNIAPTRMKTTTLDRVVSGQSLPVPDLMKLDTQGSELDILSGGKEIMGQVPLIYVECPLQTYNLGAPGLGDYLEFFEASGFEPIEIGEAHYLNNSLVQIDFLFAARRIREQL
jgi:FkbM family methyltransferase